MKVYVVYLHIGKYLYDFGLFSTLDKADEYILSKEDSALYEVCERTVF